MNDMAATIIPKSDQLNADDLIAGPITIKITGVTIRPGTEQPISISYEGDNGKPYKACKSMCRVMVTAWGADSKKYTGRSMVLYRDASVKWAGMEVGGIRISHMTDIDSTLTMALTMTKANKKPFTVRRLAPSDLDLGGGADLSKAAPEETGDAVDILTFVEQINASANLDELKVAFTAADSTAKAANNRTARAAFVEAKDKRKAELQGAQ